MIPRGQVTVDRRTFQLVTHGQCKHPNQHHLAAGNALYDLLASVLNDLLASVLHYLLASGCNIT